MLIDPVSLPPRDAYALLISALVPRPIAFVSTVSGDGVRNVAPFSFFGGISSNPPMVYISVGSRKEGPKDTARNILDTGEFVVNMVDEALAERMNIASAEFPPDVDEFAVTGLTPVPAERVGAPRVAESPVSMECRLERLVELGRGPSHVIFGEVLLFHVRDDLLREGLVDIQSYHPVGRLGGAQYCRVRDVFAMPRPDWTQILPDRVRQGE